MDKKIAYFVKKIEYALSNNNYTDAKMYYDKAVLSVGNCSEITGFKQTIDDGLKNTTPTEQVPPKAEIQKRKPINEKLIIIPVVVIGIVGYLIYYFTSIYPVKRLDDVFLGGTFYQGDVTGGYGSDGVYLEFKAQAEDNTYEIHYRESDGWLITTMDCEVINGHEITVDGYPVQVEFDNDYITFSPSFVDPSERSVWRMNRESGANDKSGNFSDNDSYYNNRLSDESNHTDSSKPSNSVQDNISTPSKNNSSNTSKPSSSTQATSKPTVNTDPCADGHSWKAATCTTPKTCTLCGQTSGSALGHTYSAATCTAPKTCTICGATSGNVAGHTWKDATCSSPAICSVCQKTSGKALDHDIDVTKCRNCSHTDFSMIAQNYSNVVAYDSKTGAGYEVTNVSINKSGVLTFTFMGKTYSVTLYQKNAMHYYDSIEAEFNCYQGDVLITDAKARMLIEKNNTYIFHFDWDYLEGCQLYFYMRG